MDWDVHHGNGTNDVFYSDPSYYISPPTSIPTIPAPEEQMRLERTAHEGFTVNVPLPSGTGDAGYLMAYREILKPIALEFKPDIVLVSAGQDPHKDDPLGGMRLTSQALAQSPAW